MDSNTKVFISLLGNLKNDLEQTYIDKNDLIKNFNTSKNEELNRVLEMDRNYYFWGNSSRNKIKKMENTSIVLFYQNNKIVYIGRVLVNFESKELSEYFWDNALNDWRYIFLMDEVVKVDIDWKVIQKILEYKEDFKPRGFIAVDESKYKKFNEEFSKFLCLNSNFNTIKGVLE